MNPTWLDFLQSQGAVIEQGQIRHFGDAPAEHRATAEATALVELSTLSLIRVHGAEALAFLNGQLSNDVRRVDAAHSQLAAWNNAKGRVVALLRVFGRNGDYYLLLPGALHATVLQRLRMFVLRAKATLENADAGLAVFGLAGSQAEALLREAVGEPPAGANACATHDGVTLVRTSTTPARFLVVAPTDAAAGLWKRLRTQARPVAADRWRWLDIAAGVPQVYPDTSEAFVPQMLNLELLDGVDFKKGCYPGQEIVARLHYRGGLKQRLYRLHADQEVRPGMPVYAPDLPGQATGAVVDAAAAPSGGTDLLAVLHTTSAARGELHLATESGPVLRRRELPYALPVAETSGHPAR